VTQLATAEQALTDSLGRLFVVAGACPKLKADDTFCELREALTSTDHQVTFAQQVYNAAVLDYNTAQDEFPAVLLARLFGFAPSALLQASPSADPL
jgi:LemA protein